MADASIGDMAAMNPNAIIAGVGGNSWLHEITFMSEDSPPVFTTICAIYILTKLKVVVDGC